MKKMRFIYNPRSGDQNFVYSLDEVLEVFQRAGYDVHLLRIGEGAPTFDYLFLNSPKDYYDAVVVSGGDGTLSRVINAMLKYGHSTPLGIIPSGTANDFASFLGIPHEPAEAAKIIADGYLVGCDAGRANDKYFINVCETGSFANISQSVDGGAKSAFGKTAYYLKGIGALSNLTPLPMRITRSDGEIKGEFYMTLVLNSSGAGGFEDLSPEASINDGKFDFIGIKAVPLVDLAVLFMKIMRRDFLGDPNIVYFQDSTIKIEPLYGGEAFFSTDLDGETGPDLPIEITNLRNALSVFVRRKD